ncbi:type III pantothenate kinase [Pseudogulbenkiania subflava]|uniref:Type III pantothenate kinase n=1 Tax=Pseudogulbenkiania subflava DSM 22618 TaxID=1123014 RepID=A0A1Y6BYB6_9NEIS|nr:type III pantothenate kinase [Pseudogulbenkiania subflava]SMF35938.1 type III pantothenate kinase [Pseudogulbenkiania subflava DSM 22618]
MKLLIDAGNTRVKWALHDGRDWLAQGAVTHADIATLAAVWAGYPIRSVHAASVASAAVTAALEAAAPQPVQWVRSQRDGGGVRNRYRDPSEQGADRWLAVLAARELCAGDVVVACAGTALTVEALTAEGDYLGGLILPGHALMLESLARGTANLNRMPGQVVAFPQGTQDALASGAADALCGAIERMRRRLVESTGRGPAELLLTGGDAERLAPWLAAPLRIVDNLVLMGLLKMAGES